MRSESSRQTHRFELDSDRVTVTPTFGGKVEIELDITPSEAGKMSEELANDEVDLASFLDEADPTDVLDYISSGDIISYVKDVMDIFVADNEEDALDKIDKDDIIEYLKNNYNVTVIE